MNVLTSDDKKDLMIPENLEEAVKPILDDLCIYLGERNVKIDYSLNIGKYIKEVIFEPEISGLYLLETICDFLNKKINELDVDIIFNFEESLFYKKTFKVFVYDKSFSCIFKDKFQNENIFI